MSFFEDFSGKWFGIGLGGGVVLDEGSRLAWKGVKKIKEKLAERKKEKDKKKKAS